MPSLSDAPLREHARHAAAAAPAAAPSAATETVVQAAPATGWRGILRAAYALVRPPLFSVLVGVAALAGIAPAVGAGLDANTAPAADLETIRGIGPALAARIVAERQRGPFRDLADLRERVRGIGEANLRRMTEAGLVVDDARSRGGAGLVGGAAGADDPGRARPWIREVPIEAPRQRRGPISSSSNGS